MAKLELDCPACAESLELDAGFAGGVCRCFECGTLMTVPAERRDRPQQLVRPDVPPGTSGRPESPLDELTYVTVSGASVEVNERDVPTAVRRRTGVRVTTALIFAGMMAAVVAACLAAMLIFVYGTGPQGNDSPTDPVILYDPQANPFLLDYQNVLGLPLNDHVVVIVDASYASRPWWGLANEALVTGLTQPGIADALLLYATEERPISYEGRYVRFSLDHVEELATFQSEIAPRGVAPLGEALDAALAEDPAQIILVTGKALSPDHVEPIELRLETEARLIFDVITIGQFNVELREMALANRGRYVDLPTGQLERWYRKVGP